MEDTGQVRVLCPNCDHPVVSAPAGFRFESDLVCPGCGALLEPPSQLQRLARGVEGVVARLLHRRRSGSDGR